MKKHLLTLSVSLYLLYAFSVLPALGQGCVAIRGFSTGGGSTGGGTLLQPGESLVSTNFRYFKSFRHFRGTHQEANRVEDGTQVINHSFFVDLSLNYAFTNRLFGSLTLPYVHHTRSSMYEHGGNPPNGLGERHTTHSSGLGDVRIGAGYWVLNPETHHMGNFTLGLGMKFPTGNYEAKDLFYNQGSDKSETRESVVDQSIQPGDGGFGVNFEIQGFAMVSENFLINGNFYYLVNPKETNGVFTRNSSTTQFSVPDQYAVRLGATYITPLHGLAVYLGGRDECVPSSDLIGGSGGYRRPGYVISLEPGLNYSLNNISAFLSVPIALVRNRTQSYLDKIRTEESGEFTQGDAAFADYLINFSISWRFNTRKNTDLIQLDL